MAASPPPRKVYYFLNDHLGTPLLITDATNKVVWERRYDPFGDCIVHPFSTIVNNFRFPGQYYDNETGLHYNYHRYYLPRTGRYVTPDPIGLFGGVNLFGYALANPINKLDPLGLWTRVGTFRILQMTPTGKRAYAALEARGTLVNELTDAAREVYGEIDPRITGVIIGEGIYIPPGRSDLEAAITLVHEITHLMDPRDQPAKSEWLKLLRELWAFQEEIAFYRELQADSCETETSLRVDYQDFLANMSAEELISHIKRLYRLRNVP